MKVFKASYQYPIGKLNIYSNNKYLLSLSINKEENLNICNNQITLYENEIIYNTKKQLDAYFKGNLQKFDLPIYIEGTDKKKKVLNKLIENVNFGSCISYSELANLSDLKNGARFVGNVLSKNQILIIIPCHRVINKDGTIGGFNSEYTIKSKLINLEKEFNHEVIH